jgi:putative nucleotidyltransferase-like protein
MAGVDPTLRPIFLLGGCAARRSALRKQTRAELARADHARLAGELAARRLLPLIGTRALEVASDLCPERFHADVQAARAAARARALAVETETRRITSLLAGAGIPALPLKGPVLADEAHGDLGLRETDDVDLLVPRSRLHDAAGFLQATGFSPPPEALRANGLPDLHLRVRHPARPTVELHWRLHWYEDTFAEEMLERAEPGPDGLLRACPDDFVAALLLFHARDGFYGMRLPADVAAWWDRRGEDLRPHFLEGHARRHPALAPALTGAAVAIERATGTPARQWLGEAAAGGRRVALSIRLGDWTQAAERDQLAANISLVGGLLGPAGSAPAFARRELVSQSGASLPHAAKMIARYARAFWRVRGGRGSAE